MFPPPWFFDPFRLVFSPAGVLHVGYRGGKSTYVVGRHAYVAQFDVATNTWTPVGGASGQASPGDVDGGDLAFDSQVWPRPCRMDALG